MPALGAYPRYVNHPQRHWLGFGVALGLGAFVWIQLAEPP